MHAILRRRRRIPRDEPCSLIQTFEQKQKILRVIMVFAMGREIGRWARRQKVPADRIDESD